MYGIVAPECGKSDNVADKPYAPGKVLMRMWRWLRVDARGCTGEFGVDGTRTGVGERAREVGEVAAAGVGFGGRQ